MRNHWLDKRDEERDSTAVALTACTILLWHQLTMDEVRTVVDEATAEWALRQLHQE